MKLFRATVLLLFLAFFYLPLSAAEEKPVQVEASGAAAAIWSPHEVCERAKSRRSELLWKWRLVLCALPTQCRTASLPKT
jgi:hypothetical protein